MKILIYLLLILYYQLTVTKMSQFIKEFGIVDEDATQKFAEMILSYEGEFQPSQLYSVKEEAKFYDDKQRVSEFRLITDDKFFEQAELIINKINELDQMMEYKLVRNDITHIRYQKGGFFTPHEDFLSLTSNVIEEYTMIICLDADCEGGQTRFHINDFFQYTSESSITPLHTLIFRKDLTHEGVPLLSGRKQIATLNLLAVPKSSGRTLVIKFIDSKETYAYPLENLLELEECMILGSLRHNKQLDSDDKILVYTVEIPKEDFLIVDKILRRCYVGLDEFKKNRDILDYYNLGISNVLISLSKDNGKGYNTREIQDGIWVFPDYSKFVEMTEITKEGKLPYIPFALVIREDGTQIIDGDHTKYGPEVSMVLFGDMGQVLFSKSAYSYDSVKNISFKEIEKYYNEHTPFECITEEDGYELDDVMYNEGVNYDLNCAFDTGQFEVKDMITNKMGEYFNAENRRTRYPEMYIGDGLDDDIREEYYSLQKDTGEMYLKRDQAKVLMQYLEKVEFSKTILKSVNEIDLVFPQHKDSDNGFLCNENVYVQSTLIAVYGYIDMSTC